MKKALLLGTILSLLLSSTCFAVPYYYNGHNYQLVGPDTWEAAESLAIALGGHLVTVNDQEEQNWLVSKFGGDNFYWIGYNDAVNEGSWVWSSGESATYTNWYAGEPNDGHWFDGSGNEYWNPSEDYAFMNWRNPGEPAGLWNDTYGGDLYGIAEWAAPAPVPEPATMLLLASGLVGLAGFRRRFKK